MVSGILLGNGFWVVNTSPTPVPKRLERSTLKFKHTHLKQDAEQKLARVFSKKSHLFFISIIGRVLKAYFAVQINNAGAHKRGKIVSFWSNFDPYFPDIPSA